MLTSRLLLPFYAKAKRAGRVDLAAFWLAAVERAEVLRAAKQVTEAGMAEEGKGTA
jgi:hypothetical protein